MKKQVLLLGTLLGIQLLGHGQDIPQNEVPSVIVNQFNVQFPKATDIAVVDVSGGCGSMYEVHVEAPDFANIRVVKQHQMVTKALAREIKDMHGIRISTSSSPKSCS